MAFRIRKQSRINHDYNVDAYATEFNILPNEALEMAYMKKDYCPAKCPITMKVSNNSEKI